MSKIDFELQPEHVIETALEFAFRSNKTLDEIYKLYIEAGITIIQNAGRLAIESVGIGNDKNNIDEAVKNTDEWKNERKRLKKKFKEESQVVQILIGKRDGWAKWLCINPESTSGLDTTEHKPDEQFRPFDP